MGLIKKLRKAKKEAPPNEKPAVVKTHLRDMIIVPEMIGSVVGIYNGKVGAQFWGPQCCNGGCWLLEWKLTFDSWRVLLSSSPLSLSSSSYGQFDSL